MTSCARALADATHAITEMQNYVDELTTRRAKDPGDDLITALLAAEADGWKRYAAAVTRVLAVKDADA